MCEYEISYEMDDDEVTGDVLAVNIYGHGRHPDAIEQLLDRLTQDGEVPIAQWDAREDWLRKVPCYDGGFLHVYGRSGRGARAVTVVEKVWGRGYWCIKHEYEPASTGFPVSQVIDGESIVARRLAELESIDDPRRNVSHGGFGAYIYMCRECATDFMERLRVARIAAAATTQVLDRTC